MFQQKNVFGEKIRDNIREKQNQQKCQVKIVPTKIKVATWSMITLFRLCLCFMPD